MITFNTDGVRWPGYIKKRPIILWIKQVAFEYGKRIGEVGYLLVDDERMLEMNRQFLNHDYYTDIITFDYSEENMLNGDIIISLDTVRSNAQEQGTSFLEELHRVLIHGILHLIGINDKGPGEREVMEKAENEALRKAPI